MAVEPKEKFLSLVRAALGDGTLVKVTLSGYRGRDRSIAVVFVRPVELRGQTQLQFVWRHEQKDVTKNFLPEDGLALLGEQLGSDFRNANIFTTAHSARLEYREGRPPRISEGAPVHTEAPSKQHDQPRRRAVEAVNARWLHGLGVTGADGKVAKGMEAKFRQINKFVELLSHLLAELPDAKGRPLRVADMGCGKGYLTFAAYEWLRRNGWPAATVRGLEARAELVELCNRVARENNFEGLSFAAGSIGHAPLEPVDMLIALHACDTATDDAIAEGIKAGASLIVVSPCCHKEVRAKLQPPAVLAGALQHGILLEREAEFATDALRAALLEWAGYRTKVLEFIATEHTGKNLMIAAVKRKDAGDREAHAAKARELAAFYGIGSQRLAEHLGLPLK